MRVRFVESVDCTGDSHPVRFSRENRQQIGDVIVRVCSDPIVQAIERVKLYLGDEEFSTDVFDVSEYGIRDPIKAKQGGRHAERHKTNGLYLYRDAEVDARHHLPPGLTGLREAVRLIADRTGTFDFDLDVRIVWAFAGDSSCSDFIRWPDGDENVVNFSNQDWWISKFGYRDHCTKLAALVGYEVTACGDPGSEDPEEGDE